MENEKDSKDELRDIAPGFPVGDHSKEPPEGYFENFPDRILNRWKEEQSYSKTRIIDWKRIAGIAASVAVLLIASYWLLQKPPSTQPEPISSLEAYQYVQENIGEFEDLIESSGIIVPESETDIPQDAIEEYLIEQLEETEPEELF